MMIPSLLLVLSILWSLFADGLGQPGKCPLPGRCPIISAPPPPIPFARPPRLPLYTPSLRLMPRRPPNNPGPLANRARILFITQELKRNITYDPQNYTGTWVCNNYCLFKGFYCDTVPDLNITGLAGIVFNGARFGGPFLNFYRFIRNLPDLAIFHANSNNFTGVINGNLNQLRYLYELDLSNNRFLGGFPASVLGATNLTFIDIRFNNYAGTVPPEVFNLDTDVLFINNNGFNQTIPITLGNTPALFLTLANNKFTGTIPPSIGRAWNTLLEVLFLNNRLTGCLPFEFGYLTRLTLLDVGGNILTGPIPESFGCLAKLELLNMAHNEFYGTIPESLCRLKNVYNLSLSYNYFTQVGPACRRMIRAKRLDVRRNCIIGLPQQKSATECSRFFSRPRSCPRPSTFNIITCNLRTGATTPSLEYYEDDESVVIPTIDEMTPPSPRSYSALERPRH